MPSLRKIYLKVLIISLSISALIGILMLLLTPDSTLWVKGLFIAISAAGYSITGVCCTLLLEKRGYRYYSYIGMVISVIGFLFSVWGIIKGAESIEDTVLLKTILFTVLFSQSWFHNSLMLLIKPVHKYVTVSKITAISINGLLTVLFSLKLLSVYKLDSEIYVRFLGILFILVAVASILAPVMQLIYKNRS